VLACAGGIALLCSGLKARGVSYTPQRVKAAIENTARSVSGLDALTVGCGVLQVRSAFDHLLLNAGRPDFDLLYKVTLPALYLRDAADSNKAFEATVNVEAVFPDRGIVDEDAGAGAGAGAGEERKHDGAPADVPVGVAHPGSYVLNKSRVAFEQKIALETSVDWIDAPGHMILHHGGRSFTAIVHGERLAPGVHYTELLGFDTAYPKAEWPSRGPLFRVSVTVLKVEDPLVHQNALAATSVQLGGGGETLAAGVSYKFANLACVGGTVHRRFVTVPEGASFVDFTVTAHSFRAADGSDQGVDPTRSFMFHALYLQPDHAFDDHESNSFFSLTGESPKKDLRMDVRPGQTLEVCITQYWSSIGPCAVDVAVEFQGLAVDNADEVVVDASSSFSPVNLRSVLRSTKLAPSAQCKTCATLHHTPYRPHLESTVRLSYSDERPGEIPADIIFEIEGQQTIHTRPQRMHPPLSKGCVAHRLRVRWHWLVTQHTLFVRSFCCIRLSCRGTSSAFQEKGRRSDL
jgi:tripeptidyl-peptidase-2